MGSLGHYQGNLTKKTLCDSNLIQFTDQGITNEMANYLTMALDPNAASIYELMKEQIENYEDRMKELQDELDEILISRNISIVELFHKIAIRYKLHTPRRMSVKNYDYLTNHASFPISVSV